MSMSDVENSYGKLLSPAEFAKAIGRTERQVYRYIQKGKVKVLQPEETGLAGNRIPASELEHFIGALNGNSLEETLAQLGKSVAGGGESRESSRVGASGCEAGVGEGETERGSERQVLCLRDLDDVDLVDEDEDSSSESLVVPLERHEAAVMRLGFLQSQLERSRMLLNDGSDKESKMRQQLENLESKVKEGERELLRAQARAEAEADGRKEAESRARNYEIRLREAERYKGLPWWKRIFLDS